MTERLSQSSVVHITSLWGVSPLAQCNGQVGYYSQLTVSTDVPTAWHMSSHAHAHTLSLGTTQFLRWQHLYWPENGLLPDFGVFACVCRHGNVCFAWYVYWMTEFNRSTAASGQNSWLICLLHISTDREDVKERAVREYPLGCLHLSSLCKANTPKHHPTAWNITNISWVSSWSGAYQEVLIATFAPVEYFFKPHYSIVLTSYGGFRIKLKNLKE